MKVKCRSRLLLGYFGEKETQECGKCDYCRAKKDVGARHYGATAIMKTV